MSNISRKPLKHQQFFRASSVKHAVRWSRHRQTQTTQTGDYCRTDLTTCHLSIPWFKLTLPPYCTVADSNCYCLGK